MKIVVQNGCEHILSRNDVETALQDINPKYYKDLKQIVLYQSKDSKTYARYYKKENILGLFGPKESGDSKSYVVDELLIALAYLYDVGETPLKELSSKWKEHYLKEINE